MNRMKYLCLLLLTIVVPALADSFTDTVKLLEAGKYEQAKLSLSQLKTEKSSPLQNAERLKHLGTVEFKLNSDYNVWTGYFDKAIHFLQKQNPPPKQELAVTHFQKANCLINYGFLQVRELRLTTTDSKHHFKILAQSVSPATKSLQNAMNFYPVHKKADILMLKADLAMLTQMLTKKESAKLLIKLYDDAYELEVASNTTPRKDVLLCSILRQAVIARQNGLYDQALALSEKSLTIISENHELNLEAELQYAATQIDLVEKRKNFEELEELLLKSIEKVEKLRTENVSSGLFFLPSRYFSKRVAAYELLLELYTKQDKTGKMLVAIDQMKARAFKDLVVNKMQRYPELDIEKVQRKLRKKQAVAVEYFLGSQKSWMFIITDDQIYRKEIACPGPQIVAKVKTVVKGYTNLKLLRHYKSSSMNPEKYKELLSCYITSNELYKLLLEPVSQLTDKPKTVYLIPHDVVNYLPFSALVKKLTPKNLLQAEFYVESGSPLSYIPSLSLLAIEYDKRYDADSKVLYRSEFDGESFYNLPHTPDEAERVADILDADIFAEDEFTREELTDESSYDVLYIASHLRKSDNPAENAVIVSAPKSLLTTRELITEFHQKINSNLTILSLCQTNIGEEIPSPGDDITTLSRAFLITGARAVLTGQWNLTDKESPAILRSTAKNYQTGGSVAESLHKAVKTYLDSVKTPFYRHPFYWANIIALEKGVTR